MRRAVLSTCGLALAAAFGCVLVTGGTDGYHAADAGTAACDASNIGASSSDAAIDDTDATVGGCLACVNAACTAEVADCEADCDCLAVASGFFGCLASGRTTEDCASTAFSIAANATLVRVGLCIEKSGCATSACGASDAGQ